MRAWIHDFGRRYLRRFALLLGLVLGSAQTAGAFDIAIGDKTSETYKLGIGLSSLIKIKLLPREDIDLQTLITANDAESLEALQTGLASFALVAVDRNQSLSTDGMEAVANLGTIGARTTVMLVRSDVDDGSVEKILQTIFDNVAFLTTVDPDLRNLDPESAVMDLPLPLHGGAKRYHAARWAAGGAAVAAVEEPSAPASASAPPIPAKREPLAPPAESDEVEAADARNYVLYFGFDDAGLSAEAEAELVEAARFAATLDDPAIIVAAYTDSVGDAEYNYLLAERRAASVMKGLNDLDVRYGRVDLSFFGERSPWSVTLDDVNEANNRRVELFIEAPVPEVQPLAIPAGYTPAAAPSDPSPSTGVSTEPAPTGTIPTRPAGEPERRLLKPKPLM